MVAHRLIGENHEVTIDQQGTAMNTPSTKETMLQKWRHLRDTELSRKRAPFLERDFGVNTTAKILQTETPESLASFWNDVKELSWPGTSGSSPWEFAGVLAASLESRAKGEHLHPDSLHSQFLAEYDQAKRLLDFAASAHRDDVAEWVGLHYAKNFSAMSADVQREWTYRYAEMHEADIADAAPAPGM